MGRNSDPIVSGVNCVFDSEYFLKSKSCCSRIELLCCDANVEISKRKGDLLGHGVLALRSSMTVVMNPCQSPLSKEQFGL